METVGACIEQYNSHLNLFDDLNHLSVTKTQIQLETRKAANTFSHHYTWTFTWTMDWRTNNDAVYKQWMSTFYFLTKPRCFTVPSKLLELFHAIFLCLSTTTMFDWLMSSMQRRWLMIALFRYCCEMCFLSVPVINSFMFSTIYTIYSLTVHNIWGFLSNGI